MPGRAGERTDGRTDGGTDGRTDGGREGGRGNKSSDVDTSRWSRERCDKNVDVWMSQARSEGQRRTEVRKKPTLRNELESGFWKHCSTSDEPSAGFHFEMFPQQKYGDKACS